MAEKNNQRRLRITQVLVQPVLIWDDGENIFPGPPMQPQAYPLSALHLLEDELKKDLPRLQKAAEDEAAQENN